ncbi:hypothetical protein [Providencia stuartii]|uniref:hypothetical protein n=1 Tax=Providencia stuartii TaxID=588 RepID=UPI0024AAC281|nr:hypothetical protein [Providencia stuartii]MCR4081611.1 hypothetical protein [Providencia stuartii]MDX7494650.1 hypothetical protein [Providencia stuartii]
MSKSYNSIEIFIARILARSPAIKQKLKKIYSHLSYYIYKKKYKYNSDFEINEISKENNETFFGYYDKHPDNGHGLVIVHCTSNSTKVLPRHVDSIAINIYSINEKKFILNTPIITTAFNWQQGSRAHWLNSDHFIYNDFDQITKEYCAKVYSVSQQQVVKKITKPVQDSYKDKFILSICYKELARLRPDYGYFKHVDNYNNRPEHIGIWKNDLTNLETKLILSLNDIIKFKSNLSNTSFEHKVNHVMISPNGQNFIFMHRYFNSTGTRFDRLILSDCNGNLLKVLADNGMVSHCFWYNDNTILAYLRSTNGKDSYWLIDINSGNYTGFEPWCNKIRGDGHPSVLNNLVITDTYPDKSRMQSLYLSPKNSNLEYKLGEFFHGFDFNGETRCDLHPRFSLCGNYIFFDSVFSGKRTLYYINITKIKERINHG